MVNKIVITFSIVLFILGCSKTGNLHSKILVTHVYGAGSEDGVDRFCSDFILTQVEAQKFFDDSKEVSIQVIHNEYDFLPCFITGSGLRKNEQCKWEIRAGGTGEIQCNNQSFLFGCQNCLPILK